MLVAVKTLGQRRSATNKEQEIARYREIRDGVKSQRGHEFVIHFHDSIATGEALGDTYLLFQPLARLDFSSLLNSNVALVTLQLVSLLHQVAMGICALHKAGFIHRDVKPLNLGIRSLEPPSAVVLDLGSTVRFPEPGITPSPGTEGTVGYIAPEMENITRTYGPKVDIWGLGCVGLQVLVERFRTPALPWCKPLSGQRFNPWRTPATFTRGHISSEDALYEMRSTHRDVLRSLATSGSETEEILLRMLAEAPHYRPSAESQKQVTLLGRLLSQR